MAIIEAIWLGLALGIIAMGGMIAIGAFEGLGIFPTNTYEWRYLTEWIVTITLATAAGNLIGRVVHWVQSRRVT
jgi:hypothetical protein